MFDLYYFVSVCCIYVICLEFVILFVCVFWEKFLLELLWILGWWNSVMGILNIIVIKIENFLDIKIIEWLDVLFCNFYIYSNFRKNIELELCYCKFNFSLVYYLCVIFCDWLCDVFFNFV